MVGVIVAVIVVVYVVPAVITALKGKYRFTVGGVWFHPLWWVGAIRLAKPDSYWARNLYDQDRLDRAYVRFPVLTTPQGQAAIARDMYGRVGKDGERIFDIGDIARTIGVSRATVYRLLGLDRQSPVPRFSGEADAE